MRNHKMITAVVFWALALSVGSAPRFSQDQPVGEDRNVVSVKVEDNRTISSETILAKIKTKTGDKFSQDIVNDDIKRLYATEYFTDVSVDVKDEDAGAAVTFIEE